MRPLLLLLLLCAPVPALAQQGPQGEAQHVEGGHAEDQHGEGQHFDGRFGEGHEQWHESFYSKLMRRDTHTSCCNLSDCRPTQMRMVGDHYEVKVEGAWTAVPDGVIQHIAAPDGGAHVCAPRQEGTNKGVLYCVILPPDM